MRRTNQSFAFGLAFFLAGAGALVAIQQTTQQVLVIRTWHSFYIAVTVASTMQEHVDYAVVRGVFRLVTTVFGGILGAQSNALNVLVGIQVIAPSIWRHMARSQHAST